MEISGKDTILRYRSNIFDMMVNAFSGNGVKPHMVDDAYKSDDGWFVMNESNTFTIFNGGTPSTKGPALEYMVFRMVQIYLMNNHKVDIVRTKSVDQVLAVLYANAAAHHLVMAHRNSIVAKVRPQMTKEQKFKYAQDRMREILGKTNGGTDKRKELQDQLNVLREEMANLRAKNVDAPSSKISDRMRLLSLQVAELDAALATLRSMDIRATCVA